MSAHDDRAVAEQALKDIEKIAGQLASACLWSGLVGFLTGAGCATVLTLAYLGLTR